LEPRFQETKHRFQKTKHGFNAASFFDTCVTLNGTQVTKNGTSLLRGAILRDWLFDSLQTQVPNLPSSILIDGSGPFPQDEFHDFLNKRISLVFNLDEAMVYWPSNTLILGQVDWNLEHLHSLIHQRSGQVLKVYSQEMFLSYLLIGKDPFDESHKFLRRFAEGHPALEYLMNLGFDWPSTLITGEGTIETDNSDWPQTGLLGYMGYKVGRSGIKDSAKRQKLLEKVYTSQLPHVTSASYMAEWGTPRSCKRLQKMSNSLAAFCRNAKGREKPLLMAISHWEEDLNWLHEKFYRGRCSFSWPSTYVG
jgi:hypothetical protein